MMVAVVARTAGHHLVADHIREVGNADDLHLTEVAVGGTLAQGPVGAKGSQVTSFSGKIVELCCITASSTVPEHWIPNLQCTCWHISRVIIQELPHAQVCFAA